MKKRIKAIIRVIYKFLRGIYRLLPIPLRLRAQIKALAIRNLEQLQISISGGTATSINIRRLDVGDLSNRDEIISEYHQYIYDILQTGKKSKDFVEYKQNNIFFSDADVKPIACYLTQFHAIPENDKWWGKGFTEWTNVTKAVPQYVGHYQPHLPLESLYDLNNVEVMKRQVELANNYGIFGFCFHYYWFKGKRLLEMPLENYLNHKELRLPFCISWANHNWTRIWDDSQNEVLISQDYSEQDDLDCISDICRYLRDDRYIRVNNKPLISIFNPSHLPDPNATIRRWRRYCRENGIGEIHLVGMDFNLRNPLIYNFDAGIAQEPHTIPYYAMKSICNVPFANSDFSCTLYDMDEYVRNKKYLLDNRKNMYRGIIPCFDNTPRRRSNPTIYPVTPELYETWMYDIMKQTKKDFDNGNRFVFINAWNEWAEGAHLEPDRKYGFAYLQATADAITKLKMNM